MAADKIQHRGISSTIPDSGKEGVLSATVETEGPADPAIM